MTMKKLLALLLVLVMVVALVACGGNGNETEAPTNNSQPASDATEDTGNSDTPVGTDLKVAVFYYTYSDTYISSVRTALDAQLDALGVTYQDFDSNGNQTTQNEAIQTAIADGYNLLIVNMVTSGSSDTAKGIMELAGDVPVIFFNRAVDEDGVEASASVLNAYENIAFVGTDAPEAGHLQGKMVGEYVLEHYDELDLNGDGKISYAMFKGDEANVEAIYRTQYGVEDANAVLTAAGKPELVYFDANNTSGYQVDLNGQWSAAAALVYMNTNLSQYNEGNNSGRGIGCISWDGKVHADQFWREHVFGNVLERPFSEIWDDPNIALLHKLKDKKAHVGGRCAKCQFLNICGGNFRARAEAYYGDEWAQDPACYLTDEEIGIK